MRYPDHLTPLQNFVRIVWMHGMLVTQHMEEFATWCIGGAAAIVALLISNLDNVSSIVSSGGIRHGIYYFVFSILAGTATRVLAAVVRQTCVVTEMLYGEFESEKGRLMLNELQSNPSEIAREISQPFFWPYKALMLRAAEQGAKDILAAEKRAVRLFCCAGFAAFAQMVAIAVGLLCIAYNIR